ncbi:NAD(P)H-binding protein (plasmid) [Rhizobium sp. RCAM05350]|uniref:NAD(P)H-binding protein n=1 Tax=Rhizobium sp. RCAM05350 TaxID=2895568 RepID=UPI0020767288|nr:NAD(P)H-binding protein [Rhizobium sp. RCAM05350]URK89391.1 NAD(P)H-binding protein [Rhizobium sp. RCAM05350]
MFVVTGVTGQLGDAIARALANLVPANEIVGTCRDASRTTDLASLGINVRQGDFGDPASLRTAFAGASQILIVSSNARAHGGDTLAQHRNAIDAARDAGAKRIVYTSHMAASVKSAFPPMHDHAKTEDMVKASGLSWTILKHGFYAGSGVGMLADAVKTGTLDTAVDGPVSWTAHADLAEAAARILTGPSLESGSTPPLTGSEALDLGQLAEITSDLLGRPVSRHVHSDDAMHKKLEERGVPAPVIPISLGFYTAARNHEFAGVDPTLQQLIGRSPIRIRDLIAEKYVQ